MAPEDYAFRCDLALAMLGEPIRGEWFNHAINCPFTEGNACECTVDLWFTGRQRAICVTADMQVFAYSIH